MKVPFYEDQERIAGAYVKQSVEKYQQRIRDLLTRLGAYDVVFMPGTYPNHPVRYGYRITFMFATIPGRIECAALPIKNETKRRKDRALAQALYLLGNALEAELHSMVYRPGAIPLIPYLIGAGDKTVTEALVESQQLPLLKG